ncbi:NADPH:quinone reductase [Daejeonella rubra]|uniref:NADPH:quinone reductase n=1 Tax=Daejeonella rubra TaxID=990371 RepID=A0A1G9MRZ3_9SPHI|nr:NAD(P)-dependent alcohol dehydrogenase [Daejeonella rubra]SDL76425.1 NADPH:quinone reductase [Daejeonella rubra]
MKAAIFKKYGPPEVLHIEEVKKPVPNKNQVLIRNYSTSVNSADWRLRKPDPFAVRLVFGLFNPKKSKQILGGVFAGIVEELGSKVTGFKAGDRVFGMTGMAMGTYAEYVCVAENSPIGLIPPNFNFCEAASIPFGATTSLHFLRKANIQKGQSILIYGASGALGTAAIQLAKYFGAEVTAVCSASNKALVKAIGADHHIDYTQETFKLGSKRYDIVFETVNKQSFADSIKCLKEKGILILGSAGISETLQGILSNISGKHKVISGLAMEKPEEIRYIQNLMADGHLHAVIDRIYSLEEIADAHRYVEAGHKKGNVVVEIGEQL